MAALGRDLRGAVRGLARRPAFLVAAATTLGLGLGATAAILSALDAVLLEPLPYPAAERLVRLWERHPELGFERDHAAPGNVVDWRRQSQTLDAVAAWWVTSRPVLGEPAPEELTEAWITEDFFPLFGVGALHGRTFEMAEVAAEEPLVVISHGLWQRRFGGDPAIVGRRLRFQDVDREVIGVMPPGFDAPGPEVEIWMPWSFAKSYARLPEVPRDARFVEAAGRLRRGVTIADAEADLGAIAARLAADHPTTNGGWEVALTPYFDAWVGAARPPLLVLSGAVVLVLLLATANVAGLLLVRAVERRQELAIRRALGATPGQLARQLVAEGLVLAAAGGALGLAAAQVGLKLLITVAPAGIPRLETAGVDGRTLAATALVSVVVGLAAGLVPAWRSLGLPVGAPRDAGLGAAGRATAQRSQRRLQKGLVVAEVALALVLLAGALLLIRSFERLVQVDPGFEPQRRLVARIFLDRQTPAAERLAYFDRVVESLRALPGVEAASASTVLPMSTVGTDFDRPYWRAGSPRPVSPDQAAIRMILPDYFETLAVPLLAGRGFTAADRRGSRDVVIVNQTLAQRLWPGESPVGQGLELDYIGLPYPYEVVGVAGDTRFWGPRSTPRPEVFIPYRQNPYPHLSFVLHTTGPPEQVAPAVRNALLEVDADQPAHSVLAMDDLVAAWRVRDRFVTLLLGTFAVVALVLAAVGLYATLAYLVRGRQREIGLRLALGAVAGDVLRLVLRQGVGLAAAGVAVGTASALALTPLLEPVLFEVPPRDVATLATVAAVLLLTALGASWWPGRRAMKVDPMSSLREE